MEIYTHLTCSTSKKVLHWMADRGYTTYNMHNIKEETPPRDFFEHVLKEDHFPLKKVFNTSGERYKELGLKDKLVTLTVDEAIDLLVSDGMLIKRPVIIDGNRYTFGSREQQLETIWQGDQHEI